MEKKIFWLTTCILFMGVLIINITFSRNGKGSLTSLNLTSLIKNATAQIEIVLPEITIECNTGGQGRCWEEECVWMFTPFGPGRFSDCIDWSGLQEDICIQNAPCPLL